ncbi:MAG TPA: hypothetical protein VK717_03460 [Opitutaceae bacterium]|jgi:hypothetical protein|nr:hypothetical protein [Opitutaceae bacterium]
MKSPIFRFLILLAAWGLAATAAGAVHLLFRLPVFAVPVLVGGLTVALAVAVSRVAWLSEAVRRISVRGILTVHLIRFVGFYFLWLHTLGRLPAEFAHNAGWGDVVAAVGALALLFWPEGPGFRRALVLWNVVGLADLFVAVGTGGWLSFTRPGSMIELAGLPLTLVPLWAVPVLIVSHFVIFRRLCEAREATGAPLVSGMLH